MSAELPLIVQPVRVMLPPWMFDSPPPCAGGVAADRAAGEGQVAAVVLYRPPPNTGGIAADRAAGQSSPCPRYLQSTTFIFGGIAADRAAGEGRQCP